MAPAAQYSANAKPAHEILQVVLRSGNYAPMIVSLSDHSVKKEQLMAQESLTLLNAYVRRGDISTNARLLLLLRTPLTQPPTHHLILPHRLSPTHTRNHPPHHYLHH